MDKSKKKVVKGHHQIAAELNILPKLKLGADNNLTHIPHFRHVVQKDTWIIITILSQQIKQINSIEHKKLVAWIFWANQGFLLAA